MGLHGIARRLRTALRGLHRTLGLGLGALFALTGLSGSVLVFYQEIDAELHPALHTSAVTEPIVWEEVLQSLRREFPAMDGAWRLELDTRKGAVAARYYATPQAQARGRPHQQRDRDEDQHGLEQPVLPVRRSDGKAEPDRGECGEQGSGIAVGSLHGVANSDRLRQATPMA
jgi:hypothetical protein